MPVPVAYYNDNDPFAAAWLRELIADGLIAPGDVDERSIADVRPDDLRGYTQCHFFAGIGGWSRSFRLAGIPDHRPVWSGSCPCPPFSSAVKRAACPACAGRDLVWCPRRTGFAICSACRHAWLADARHLWPEFWRLIAERRPLRVYGEQVASEQGLVWLAGVRGSLEILGYDVGAADLPSCGVGAPHIRQRLFWVADALRGGAGHAPRQGVGAQAAADGEDRRVPGQRLRPGFEGATGGRLADHDSQGCSVIAQRDGGALTGRAVQQRPDFDGRGDVCGLANANGRQPRDGDLQRGGEHRQQPQDDGADVGLVDASRRGRRIGRHAPQPGEVGHADGSVQADGLGHPETQRHERHQGAGWQTRSGAQRSGDRLVDAVGAGLEGHVGQVPEPDRSVATAAASGFWDRYAIIATSDGKRRRIVPEPEIFPLAAGIPNRVGTLRGAGNAINPEVAAEFIRVAEEAVTEQLEVGAPNAPRGGSGTAETSSPAPATAAIEGEAA